MSTLRQVLQVFEQDAQQMLTIHQIARHLNISHGLLEGMLSFWVQKGELEIVDDATAGNCTTCGIVSECPFVTKMPTRYALAGVTLATPDCAANDSATGCNCGT